MKSMSDFHQGEKTAGQCSAWSQKEAWDGTRPILVSLKNQVIKLMLLLSRGFKSKNGELTIEVMIL